MSEIASAAVLGAGVMGAAIAAHLANAGLSVLLLDLVPKEGRRRNALAEAALERLKKSEPPAFMHPSAAAGVTAGNLEDDLGRLSDVDWTIEAIVEDLELKQGLLARAAAATRPDAILSSNTSTLTLELLRERLPEQAARRLLVTHFFNPPRYVRLLELVIPPGADPDAAAAITSCAEERLGKTVVTVEDRPGFIANRIGSFWIQSAVTAALELGLTVEEVDAVVTAAFGVPKTGIFGLLDLVGLDLACMVAASLRARLPPDDPCHTLPPLPAIMQTMITDGRTGRKGASGFYRLAQEGGRRVKEALDLVTDRYRPAVSRPRTRKPRGRAQGPAVAARPPRPGWSIRCARDDRDPGLRRPRPARDRRRRRCARSRDAAWLRMGSRAFRVARPTRHRVGRRSAAPLRTARASPPRRDRRAGNLLPQGRWQSGCCTRPAGPIPRAQAAPGNAPAR